MQNINVQFYIDMNGGKEKVLCFKVLDSMWRGPTVTCLFGEIGECVLFSSYKKVCFDLSNLNIMESSNLGVFSHFARLAEKQDKQNE